MAIYMSTMFDFDEEVEGSKVCLEDLNIINKVCECRNENVNAMLFYSSFRLQNLLKLTSKDTVS